MVGEIKGILFGLGAAALYATVVMLNKVMKDISAYDKTIIQLASAAIVLLPYCLATIDFEAVSISIVGVVMLLIVGVLHTGVAYGMYFGAIKVLPTQTVAILSYIDPVVAVLLSATLLKEGISLMGIIGAVLILGSTFVNSVSFKKE